MTPDIQTKVSKWQVCRVCSSIEIRELFNENNTTENFRTLFGEISYANIFAEISYANMNANETFNFVYPYKYHFAHGLKISSQPFIV